MAPRFPIKLKSAGVLTLPLAMLVVVAGLEVADGAREVREVREQTDLATSAIGPSGVVTALQNERNFTTIWLLGADGVVDLMVDSVEEARQETDAAAEAFRAEVARKGGDVERIYTPALDALHGLPAVRTSVDEYEGPRVIGDNPTLENMWQSYSRLITALSNQNSQLTIEVSDEELRDGVRLIDMASREIDRIAQFVRVSVLAAVTGDARLADRDEIMRAAAIQHEAIRWHLTIIALAEGPHRSGTYAEPGEQLRVESDATGVLNLSQEIMETGRVDVMEMFEAISLQEDESYYGFVTDVSERVRARADELNSAARTRQRWYTVLAGLVVVAAAVVGPLVGRSISRPLRSLTRQAADMAQRRLPQAVRSVLEIPRGEDVVVPELEPIRVDADDEVADVAEALNVVQSAAVDLAVEQALLRRNAADVFVSLARRNQNLLIRQLDFVNKLEANESRSTNSANLFRLAHQATRMRRNAESLLVLAGAGPSRRWAKPVALLDVLRAALAEVEDYHRVSIPALAPAAILGGSAADLTHLLAELIENALRYSPASRPVEIYGHAEGEGEGGGYLLAIVDAGFGMDSAEMAAANRRLAQAESFTVAPSRYLGHYVAGSLAARHDITVRLRGSAGRGVTATVRLPPRILVEELPEAEPAGAPLEELVGEPEEAGAQPGALPPPPAPPPPPPPPPPPETPSAAPAPPPASDPVSPPAAAAPSPAAGAGGNGWGGDAGVPPRPSVVRRSLAALSTMPTARPAAAQAVRSRATEMHDLLNDFAAGVARGLEECGIEAPSTEAPVATEADWQAEEPGDEVDTAYATDPEPGPDAETELDIEATDPDVDRAEAGAPGAGADAEADAEAEGDERTPSRAGIRRPYP